MDVVEYLLEQRRRSYEILKKNGIKQEVVTGHCPQCQQLKQEIEYEQQYINPTVPEAPLSIEQKEPEKVIHIYTDDESESESVNESEEDIETTIESEIEESVSECEDNITEESESDVESESEIEESVIEDTTQQQTQNQTLPLFL